MFWCEGSNPSSSAIINPQRGVLVAWVSLAVKKLIGAREYIE